MSIKTLQSKIGAEPDGQFGPATLKAAKEFYDLSAEEAAHFFAQIGHETADFSLFTENLNYSAGGLLKIFSKYFIPATATEYARNPQKIANKVYANRMGNGNEASGDGWKYRGRGALQLTGKNNYKAFAEYLKKPEIITNPDLVTSDYSFQSAMFFFDKNKLWDITKQGVNEDTIQRLTRKINNGYNGLPHRRTLTYKYYNYLK